MSTIIDYFQIIYSGLSERLQDYSHIRMNMQDVRYISIEFFDFWFEIIFSRFINKRYN